MAHIQNNNTNSTVSLLEPSNPTINAEEEYSALITKTATMLTLMVVAINVVNILKMKGFHLLSETTIFVLIGLFVGLIFVHITSEENTNIQLKSSFFYMVLLPPIIFEGGFTLQRITFVRNLVPILSLALFGAMYSTIITSILMYLFTRLISPAFTVLDCLIFGSIISSTDPVSVLGMLPPSTDRNLYMLIFGESALNDAVALILYRFFRVLATEEGHLTPLIFLESFAGSFLIFLESSLVGICVALIFAKLTKHVKPPEAPIFELVMFLVFAYGSYLIAEVVQCTGIISVFFCGVTMAHYAYDNLSKVTLLSAKVCLRTFSSMCDAFVFLYLGLGLVAFRSSQTEYNIFLILAALISILISRTHVYIIAFFHNLVWRQKDPQKMIPRSHQIFLWFCGLRGAVSFALAVNTLDIATIDKQTGRQMFGTIIMVVSVTVVGMGGLTPHVMKWLGLTGAAPTSAEGGDGGSVKDISSDAGGDMEMQQVAKSGKTSSTGATPKSPLSSKKPTQHGSIETLDEYMPHEGTAEQENAAEFMAAINNGFWIRLYELDKRYIKPFFSVTPKPKSKKFGGGVATRRRSDGSLDHISEEGEEQTYDLRKNLDGVFSAFDEDDKDDDEDDLDRVSIARASEMFGIAGSTLESSQNIASASGRENTLRSRAGSITSLRTVGGGGGMNRRSSVATIARKNATTESVGSNPVLSNSGPGTPQPSIKTAAKLNNEKTGVSGGLNASGRYSPSAMSLQQQQQEVGVGGSVSVPGGLGQKSGPRAVTKADSESLSEVSIHEDDESLI